jgi:hypothetical protein
MPIKRIKVPLGLKPRRKAHRYELVGRVLDRNPDYGLSHKEIVAKTGLSSRQVSRSLQTLRAKGLADRIKKPLSYDIRGNWVPMTKLERSRESVQQHSQDVALARMTGGKLGGREKAMGQTK